MGISSASYTCPCFRAQPKGGLRDLQIAAPVPASPACEIGGRDYGGVGGGQYGRPSPFTCPRQALEGPWCRLTGQVLGCSGDSRGQCSQECCVRMICQGPSARQHTAPPSHHKFLSATKAEQCDHKLHWVGCCVWMLSNFITPPDTN